MPNEAINKTVVIKILALKNKMSEFTLNIGKVSYYFLVLHKDFQRFPTTGFCILVCETTCENNYRVVPSKGSILLQCDFFL